MTTIENLSNEVIYIILQQKIISIEDVVSFGLTCRRFLNAICHNNTLWQMKVYQRWPHMERIYDKRIQNKERINFKDDVKASIKCRNELRSHLSLMSERFFQKDNFSESDVEHFDALFCPNMGAHIMNYYFLKDEMIHMITMSSLLPDCNLTHKYYSRELLLYLQQRHTKDVWQEFISYPKEQQLLEEAATIAAQWYQPQKYVFYFEVVASLDNIAQLVLKHLKKVLENKVGDAVSLAIIFQSVARRLGVRCNLVAFPTHFFLSWKPKSITEKSEDEECFCIDILHGGAMVGFTHRNDCPRTRGRRCPIENFNKHNEISPTEVVLRMIYHLQMVNPDYQHYQDRTLQIRSLMEFRYMINPYNIDAIQELGRNYMQNQMNLSGLLISLQKILNSEIVAIEAMRAEELLNKFKLYMQKKMTRPSLENISPPKVRCNIKYAIGMIVTFKKYVPNYAGVIIGWDKMYNLSNPEKDPEKLKIIDMLESFMCVLQPFYFILSEDGNKYYAPEDSLIETCPPRWIEHNEIGRYFCRFARTHYVPNEVLKRQYMFDELVLDGL
ncbi:PREDICTED: F-box only protein 21-like isoform X3 [Trachymyrmex septentrionalis]|uniref:F-box only protein 21-like isoform X3 n=1 Tax=Trachymyrmex septentrionalis TaxID=34720 RepID=UPI00084F32D0|nr:PREDICTED: F-box only protein 21-like isoform X3 [Trachymyrmex septentrionalis]